jgi:hypothetical protein
MDGRIVRLEGAGVNEKIQGGRNHGERTLLPAMSSVQRQEPCIFTPDVSAQYPVPSRLRDVKVFQIADVVLPEPGQTVVVGLPWMVSRVKQSHWSMKLHV